MFLFLSFYYRILQNDTMITKETSSPLDSKYGVTPILLQQPLEVVESSTNYNSTNADTAIGKKHALKKYDQFALDTSCFSGSNGSNITWIMQIFVTTIMNRLIREIAQL